LTQCDFALSQNSVWPILGNFVVYALDYGGMPAAMKAMVDLSFKTTPAAIKGTVNFVSFALATISVVLDAAALIVIPEPRELSEVGLLLGGIALILSGGSFVYQTASPEGALGPATSVDKMALLGSLTSTLLSGGMYVGGY
jgi:hypothetical protein